MEQVLAPNQTKDPFYRDGRIYDLMHERLVADKDFFVQMALECGGPVLEIACGTGRITIPIALAKTETFGLDISEEMLSEARKKALELGAKVSWIQGDCRNCAGSV
jgi:ubiquinone/menaquinone biosynthesis C-methylase UbiE